MRRALFVPLVGVLGLLAAGCVEPPPPDPDPEFCPVGYFSADGEEPCTPAPLGTFVDVEGATEATPCPVGTFQDLEGQVACNVATPGTFVDFEGAAAAIACPPGRFQPDSGAVECLVAPIGTYVDVTGAIAATDCPPGTTTEFVGATSADDCVERLLAVAYSNLDGIAGYDPDGTDVLIAKVVDTNLDGAPSTGDTVVANQYPLDFGATAFGDFNGATHVVTGVATTAPGFLVVDLSTTIAVVFNSANGGEFGEFESGTSRTLLLDAASFDRLKAAGCATCLLDPDTPVVEAARTNSVDDGFIEVEVFD